MRDKLGAFIRAQRERASPAALGLETPQRRRTPGLRREDLARLADALRLSAAERH
ncbi:hypothetical protein [Janthinobacterium sp.]|uniref:hypothetical protein n=1 Tax=Janthinobacterium sp. TaxID=1871054 RepID=UPI003977D143